MVPKGWEKNSLDSLFEFKNGLNTEKEQYGNGYKFVNVMDVFRNDILTESKIIGRVQVTDKQLEGYQLKYGDVLFNRTSETFDEIAIAAIYLDNAIATFGGFVIRARPKGNQIDPAYSVFCFNRKAIEVKLLNWVRVLFEQILGKRIWLGFVSWSPHWRNKRKSPKSCQPGIRRFR